MRQTLFLKTAILSAAAAAVLTACGGDDGNSDGGGAGTAPPAISATRTTLNLERGWKFVQNDALTDAQALAANGEGWQSVNLPHTWNEKDAANTEQTTPDSVSYKRGLGWYRLDFDAPADGGGTQWLQFDGASIVADVWLNGRKLGQHKGAFTAFRFDVTQALNRGGQNTLIVKTNNTAPVGNDDVTAIAPLSGDFNMSGGLYRGVSLVATAAASHIALDDFGSTGVKARTESSNQGRADVSVRVKLSNDTTADAAYVVKAKLVEADGATVKATAQQAVRLKAKSSGESFQSIAVDAPRLWQGLADPYLYKLAVELLDANGSTLDEVVQDFGIRTMQFDPDQGFFLNGRSVPLRGVNMHQDYEGKAWAISQKETDESLALIKEMGANTIRLAHYPHARYTLEQADKLGFVVMAEIPFVNSSSLPANGSCTADPELTGFGPNVRQQLTELIRQQYNHASIGLWSIANEVTTIANLCGQSDANNNLRPLLRSLQMLAKNEDPSRMTTQAQEARRSGDTLLPSLVTISDMADSYSMNRYFLWYYGTDPAQIGAYFDDQHAKFAGMPLGLSEYGAGAALTHQTDNPLGGRVCSRDATGSRRICYQPEGYANYVHEEVYKAIEARPYLYGTYVWNMFDFGSGIRHEGDVGATNTKGLVTFDRQTKKDAFYFYKANWSQAPVTFIAGRRYTDRAYQVADVTVYHNGGGVSLSVNGRAVGTLSGDQCPVMTCIFKGVKLDAGSNAITAVGTHAGSQQTDTVTWNLAPEQIRNVNIAAGQLATGFVSNDALLGQQRYGSDNFFVGGDPLTLPPMTVIGNLGSAAVPDVGRPWDAVRKGASFAYDVPVQNGSYQVVLGFVEPTVSQSGARVFGVRVNGQPVAENLDVFQQAGGQNVALRVTANAVVVDGRLRIDFQGVVGEAIVSNISIRRQ